MTSTTDQPSTGAALTTDELRSLNERGTSTDTPSPERIAKKWLAQKKLLDD